MKDNRTTKVYSSPKLESFGDIRTITQNVATNGNLDGAGGVPPRRTQS